MSEQKPNAKFQLMSGHFLGNVRTNLSYAYICQNTFQSLIISCSAVNTKLCVCVCTNRFVNSWSGDQLRATDLADTGTCEPLRRNGSDDDSGNVFLPCGVIANSLFNGTMCINYKIMFCVGVIIIFVKVN